MRPVLLGSTGQAVHIIFGCAPVFKLTGSPFQPKLLDPNPKTNTVKALGCGVGQFSNVSTAPCTRCNPGSVTNTLGALGATSCTACASGQVSNLSSSACVACPPGSVTNTLDLEAATNCTSCTAGQFSSTSTIACASVLCNGSLDAVSVPSYAEATGVHGTAAQEPAQPYGSTIIFACSVGYTSSVTYTCVQESTAVQGFFNTSDSCSSVQCLVHGLESPPHGSIAASCSDGAFLNPGTSCTVFCALGFSLVGT